MVRFGRAAGAELAMDWRPALPCPTRRVDDEPTFLYKIFDFLADPVDLNPDLPSQWIALQLDDFGEFPDRTPAFVCGHGH